MLDPKLYDFAMAQITSGKHVTESYLSGVKEYLEVLCCESRDDAWSLHVEAPQDGGYIVALTAPDGRKANRRLERDDAPCDDLRAFLSEAMDAWTMRQTPPLDH
jgi:hypothetical protein